MGEEWGGWERVGVGGRVGKIVKEGGRLGRGGWRNCAIEFGRVRGQREERERGGREGGRRREGRGSQRRGGKGYEEAGGEGA